MLLYVFPQLGKNVGLPILAICEDSLSYNGYKIDILTRGLVTHGSLGELSYTPRARGRSPSKLSANLHSVPHPTRTRAQPLPIVANLQQSEKFTYPRLISQIDSLPYEANLPHMEKRTPSSGCRGFSDWCKLAPI